MICLLMVLEGRDLVLSKNFRGDETMTTVVGVPGLQLAIMPQPSVHGLERKRMHSILVKKLCIVYDTSRGLVADYFSRRERSYRKLLWLILISLRFSQPAKTP